MADGTRGVQHGKNYNQITSFKNKEIIFRMGERIGQDKYYGGEDRTVEKINHFNNLEADIRCESLILSISCSSIKYRQR